MVLASFANSVANPSCMQQFRELSKVLHQEKEKRRSGYHFPQHWTSMYSGSLPLQLLLLSRCFLPLTGVRVVVRHSNMLYLEQIIAENVPWTHLQKSLLAQQVKASTH